MDEPVRIDRWLWTSRLVKTRALAAEAVKGGRVHLNGVACKPSRDVRPGDTVRLFHNEIRRTVVVRGTAARRGPAAEALKLYAETPESIEARERFAAERRLSRPPVPVPGARPTKRARRRYDALVDAERR